MLEYKKILTIYYKHKPGGFCKRLRMKIHAYLDRGWVVHYVAVEPFPYSHPNLITHILPTPMRNHDSIPFWIYFFFAAPFYLARVGMINKVHLISVFSPLYALISVPAKWFLKVPMITFVRFPPHRNAEFSFQESGMVTRLKTILDKIGLAFSDRVLATSNAVREAILKRHSRSRKKIGVLYNHLENIQTDRNLQKERLTKEFSLTGDPFIIATSGVLHKRKNQDFLLRALAEAETPRAVLIIVGDGDQKEILKKLAEELGVAEQTIFTGWREDVMEIIQGADLFAYSSFKEGLSNSLLEAVAVGIPCLVSDTPENREVISNPEQHFSADQPLELAKKFNQAIDDREYYDGLVKSTLEDRKRFVFDWNAEIIREAEGLLNRPK